MRKQLLSIVNTGIHFSIADNESKNGNLNTYSYIIKVVVPTAAAMFATSNETFSVSQTPSLSSLSLASLSLSSFIFKIKNKNHPKEKKVFLGIVLLMQIYF